MSEFLPFALPDIGQEEIDEVVSTLRSGWITTGPKTAQFEQDFAKFIGSTHALAVNSATAGLHLALEAIGLSRGDLVVVPAYTFTATAEVVRYFDANVVFCDSDASNYNMCPKALESILKSGLKVKAVIPVHIAGYPCAMEEIMALAKKYEFRVIEDSAHALPAKYSGINVGTIGDIGVFSFYATKTISTAEGGMVVTNNDDYKKRMQVMRLHGFDRSAWDRYSSPKGSWYYEIVEPGFKYNMTDIAASMGIHQLRKANLFHAKRVAMAKEYNSFLENKSGIEIPNVSIPIEDHSFHLYIVQVATDKRDAFILKLKEKGIGSSVHFIPLHLQPYWAKRYRLKPDDFPVAKRLFEGAVSLPIYTKMTAEDLSRVKMAVDETLCELRCKTIES